MAGKIVADTLEHSTAGSLDTQYVVNGSAKAFGNIESGTTLVESFNESAFTDNGTGDFTHNFTNSMANKNHVTTGNNMRNSNGGYGHTAAYGNSSDTSSTSGSARMVYTNVSNNTEDMRRTMAVTHGDLA